MSRGWKTTVARALGISRTQFHAYQNGSQRIPETIFDRARALPKLPDPLERGRKFRREEPPIPDGTVVLNDGPMSADELRLIGFHFNPEDWRSGIAGIAMAKKKTIAEWPKRGVPQGQAKLLRRRYHESIQQLIHRADGQ